MAYHPEGYSQLVEGLGREELPSRERLAELLAFMVGIDDNRGRDIFKKALEASVDISPERRKDYLVELKSISEEMGWGDAQKVLNINATIKEGFQFVAGLAPEAEIYHTKPRRPEEITNYEDFSESGVSYWIPEKTDIRRFIETAKLAHERSGRTGTMRIIDVGGGSGFVSKLIADEARESGAQLDVIVIDPDKKSMEGAAQMFADTPNLHFEVGDAVDAVRRFGPKLSPEQAQKFEALESARKKLVQDGRGELAHIKALQATLELNEALESITGGSFGERAKGILTDAGVVGSENMETIRDKVMDHYLSVFNELDEQINNLRRQQEEIFSSIDPRESGADLVINSWMPLGLDFTREIRWISAPAIIYSRDRTGACGFEGGEGLPADLGKEESFRTGEKYDNKVYWENNSRDGVITNLLNVQVRKGVNLEEDEILSVNADQDKEYKWEASLKSPNRKWGFLRSLGKNSKRQSKLKAA
jgi:SAM-dependent methyltransferase